MPDVPIRDAMIVWTPNSELWQNHPNAAPAGSVCVVNHPDEANRYTSFPKSDGACTENWRDITDSERLQRLQRIKQDLLADGVAEDAIQKAFSVIPEARRI